LGSVLRGRLIALFGCFYFGARLLLEPDHKSAPRRERLTGTMLALTTYGLF
jgi:hypothetical protein